MNTEATPQQQTNLLSLIAAGQARDANTLHLSAQPIVEDDDDHEEARDVDGGPVWSHLDANDAWPALTNFSRTKILSMYHDLRQLLITRRGRKPEVTDLDALVVYLVWAKMGLGYKRLSALLGLKKGKMIRAIDRIRLPLLQHPYIGLLVDSTTTETCRPGGPFAEVKLYFDVKNNVYGLKKEVAVSAHAPHYAMFTSTFHLGSEHDYSIHKHEFGKYITYLSKTGMERGLIPADAAPNFAILGDSAYIGPDSDTPGLRRVAILKHSQVQPHERAATQELKRLRVPFK